jgi:hypothetical protein
MEDVMSRRLFVGTSFALVAVAVILFGIMKGEVRADSKAEPVVCSDTVDNFPTVKVCRSSEIICGVTSSGISCVKTD